MNTSFYFAINGHNLKYLHNLQTCRVISYTGISKSKNGDITKNGNLKANDGPKVGEPEKMQFPEEPTTCCMSGCANCVWLDYAEKLTKYYSDGGDQAVKEINEKITDQNIKAFLLHEFRMRNIKTK